MTSERLLSTFLVLAMTAGLFLVAFSISLAGAGAQVYAAWTSSLEPSSLPPPDYDSGWINLPEAVAWDNPGTIIYPDDVDPSEATLNHNLGTYDILVYTLANDEYGRYVQMPNPLVGGYGQEDNWFLTSQNQIMLRNWDYNRAVPVHVMIWKPLLQMTFDQTGLNSDFTGTVLTVDANNYRVADLPVSFWWNLGSSHSFAYQSPLLVTPNAKQYLWTSTSGLSTLQSGSITVATSGNVTGNYKTQYYLTVTSPYDSPTPESGWFDSGSSITESVTSPVSGISGTQYACTGWTGTGSVSASGTSTSTSFVITQASSITWNWKTQYFLTVSSAYGTAGGQGWYDSGSTAYATVTPLTVSGGSGTQYVFTNWGGDASGSTSPSNPITMNGPKTATANWKTQHYLAVKTDPVGIAIISGEGWYDQASLVALTSPVVQNYTFGYWDVDGADQGNGINPITTTMNAPHVATAHYVHLNPLTVHIQPTSATINLGQSVTFTSTVQGGIPPYTYRWYLNGNPVFGATSSGWVFTPSAAGIHYVYLQVTDFSNTTAQSETARIVVTSVPVGGYSVPIKGYTITKPLTPYLVLMAILIVGFATIKRKATKRKTK